ncbi:MAG: hypothetical protein GWO24_04880 [Akkermansiaceae bacterium]|nr:hypothetical protein [Akkermansiaceae bacterium]
MIRPAHHVRGAALVAVFLVVLAFPGSLRAKDPPPAVAKAERPIAERIVGHWGVDRNQMLKVLIERAAEGANGEGFDAAAKDLLVEMVNNLADRMILEFTAGGISRVHSPDHEDEARFTILKADESTGQFTLEVKAADGEPDTPKGKVEGDVLTLESDDLELHFRRLNEKEAEARLAALKKEGDKSGPGKEDQGGEAER